MRRSTLLIASLLLLLAFAPDRLAAQIHVVNPDGTGDFISIQEALDAPSVVNGDTIFVVFGVYNESVVVRKGVTLMGGGYYNPEGNPTHLFTTQGIGIRFSTGANGATLEGFFVQGHSSQKGVVIDSGVEDVRIHSNYLKTEFATALEMNGSVRTLVEHNFIEASTSNVVLGQSSVSNVIIRNNAIRSTSSFTLNISSGGEILSIYNNIIIGTFAVLSPSSSNGSSTIYGNITIATTGGTIYNIGGGPFFFGYNHTHAPGGATLNNPSFMVPGAFSTGDPLFVNHTLSAPFDIATVDLRLSEDSPAIDQGRIGPSFNDIDGTRNDCGVYGGPFPFRTGGGTPALPVVIALEVTPARVQPGGTIQIRVTGKIGQ
jgi:hypothetical protein